MAVVMRTPSRRAALDQMEELLVFNAGRGGQYRYVYVKELSSGGYEVGLLQQKSTDKRLLRQEEIRKKLPFTTPKGWSLSIDDSVGLTYNHRSRKEVVNIFYVRDKDLRVTGASATVNTPKKKTVLVADVSEKRAYGVARKYMEDHP